MIFTFIFALNTHRKTLIHIVLAIGVLALGYFIYDNVFTEDEGGIGVQYGDYLLDETIISVNGTNSVKFSDFKGRVLVIDFMAPWCSPCRAQIPILRLVNSVDGVEVVSINVDPTYDKEYLTSFAQQEQIEWFFGNSPQAAREFEVTAIPTIIIVDKEGLIVYRGFFTSGKDFERILTGLID